MLEAMSEAERRALARATALLLLVSVGRWAWATRREPVAAAAPDVLPELLEAATREAADEEARSRPLAPGERIDPNRASEQELDRLPGVGPATARAIVAEREAAGGFRSAADLTRVRGLGSATLERIGAHLDFAAGVPPERARLGRRRDPAPELVDVNRADVEALDALPGIGPALAARIVEERNARPFRTVEDLSRVPGIGPATVERLRGRVSVGSAPW
jgi:competence protein ComEA